MSTKKSPFQPPEDMIAPVVGLKDLGLMLCEKHGLPAGKYDMVVQYHLGTSQLRLEKDPVPAVAVTLAGIGLKAAPEGKESVHTLDYVPAKLKSTSKRSSPKA